MSLKRFSLTYSIILSQWRRNSVSNYISFLNDFLFSLQQKALSLWVVFLCGGSITFFIDNSTAFTLSNGTMVVILLGLQCAMELIAGIYYEKQMEGKEDKMLHCNYGGME